MTTATLAPSLPRSKARDPRSVELSRRRDGSYGALSSDGATIYTVRPVGDAWQCQCAGYAARGQCCHVLAVQLATRCCDWCGKVGDVGEYINGFDSDVLAAEPSRLRLCNACLNGGR